MPVPLSMREEMPDASVPPVFSTMREKDSRPSKTSSLMTAERIRSEPAASRMALLEASKVRQMPEASRYWRFPERSVSGSAPEGSPLRPTNLTV